MESSQRLADTESQIERLSKIIASLRGENGCPWDRQQTPRSITVYLVEEVYELIEAIHDDEAGAVREELGDVLFQLLFVADVYRERGLFDMEAAARTAADKMIRRHPHVFGDKQAISVDEVKDRWHLIKQQEKEGAASGSVLDSVPRHLPALLRAYRVSSRAAKAGFDWQQKFDVMAKAEEELAELAAAVTDDDQAGISEELGDLFFTFVNLARFLRVHPETALTSAIAKFEARFRCLEESLAKQGKTIAETDFNSLDALWEAAKQEEAPR